MFIISSLWPNVQSGLSSPDLASVMATEPDESKTDGYVFINESRLDSGLLSRLQTVVTNLNAAA